MSDAILRVLEVFEDIKRERETSDGRSDRQVVTDALESIADDLDVPPATVLDSIVAELKPDVTSVEKLERAIDDWLKGGSELKRILNKQARDQIDARAVGDLFRHPVARAKGKSKGSGAKAPAVAETPPATKKAKPDRKAEAAAEAAAEARERAQAAEQAEAEARAQAEEAAQAAAEARARVQAAEQAEAEARARARAAEKAEAEARARAEAAEKAEAKARARAQAAEEAEAEARDRAEAASEENVEAARAGEPLRTVTLDDDVAEFFPDERAVNDFLRASIAAMRHTRRSDERDEG